MRNAIVIFICIICLTGILSGCKNTDNISNETATTAETTASVDDESINIKEKEDVADKSSDVENDVSWRQFLKDYETWVDTYVEFMEKYKDNPTDVSLISDYSKFVQQTAEWAEEAEKYQSDLENASPEILGEYVETLGRITKRIIEIAY